LLASKTDRAQLQWFAMLYFGKTGRKKLRGLLTVLRGA